MNEQLMDGFLLLHQNLNMIQNEKLIVLGLVMSLWGILDLLRMEHGNVNKLSINVNENLHLLR
jgi:hypothetical protein